ncbi:MAG: hypothetical protein LWW75_06430 [Chlorobiales bacterium]|nr:hypothetical protein [Chlorobiales bacterium]
MTITINEGDPRPVGVICADGTVIKDLIPVVLYDGREVFEGGDVNAKSEGVPELLYEVDEHGIIVRRD